MKCSEAQTAAPLPGWSRFRHAQEWLDRYNSAKASPEVKRKFDQFLSEARSSSTPEDREALFRQFLEWQKLQPVAPAARPSPARKERREGAGLQKNDVR